MSACEHVFRHKDDYCIRCERRVRGRGEPHRAPRPTDLTVERRFVETPVIDTSRAQDDYYDDAGFREAPAPDSLTEQALREVLR